MSTRALISVSSLPPVFLVGRVGRVGRLTGKARRCLALASPLFQNQVENSGEVPHSEGFFGRFCLFQAQDAAPNLLPRNPTAQAVDNFLIKNALPVYNYFHNIVRAEKHNKYSRLGFVQIRTTGVM